MPSLLANDVDVYHGSFGDGSLKVWKDSITYFEDVDEIDVPINTVQCSNLSSELFLCNNDLNVTAACLHVVALSDEENVSFSKHHTSPF